MNNQEKKIEMELLQQYRKEDIQKVYDSDITNNWQKTSKLIFYMQIVAVIVFLAAASVALYNHRYMGKPDISDIPKSSLYTPKYKQ